MIGELVCEGLEEGKALKDICQSSDALPDERTVRRWIRDESHPLSPLYARARETGLQKLGDDVLALADSADENNYQAVKLAIDARKWYLSKLMPKVYGDRQHLDVESKVEVTQSMPTDAELARILAAAIAETQAPMLLEARPVTDTGLEL
jgi:hypothetical protein